MERDPTKSFFNLFWKGIEQGLKKTLIGINIDTSKKGKGDAKAKETKPSVKEAKAENNSGNTMQQPAEQKEKKGFLKGIFKKKIDPEIINFRIYCRYKVGCLFEIKLMTFKDRDRS
uniref:Uncharacterized protein n=1 Tax=Chryseobacterium endophyticum TaxID=1854762 RepID=A0AAU6WT85_9FLAO